MSPDPSPGAAPSTEATQQGCFPRIGRFLLNHHHPGVEEALIAALPTVHPAVADELVGVILRRGGEDGLVGLIRVYHLLPRTEQDRLAREMDRLSGAVCASMVGSGSQNRLNAISLIREARDCRSAYLLVTALCDSNPEVSASAAEALADLVYDYLREQAAADQVDTPPGDDASQARQPLAAGTESSRSDSRRFLLEAVRQALQTFHVHQKTETVKLAMQLAPYTGEQLSTFFPARLGRLFRTALDIFQSSSDPDLVGFAYMALASRRWREPVARSISERVRPAFVVGMIREIRWLEDPRVREGLQLIKKLTWLRRSAAPVLSLPEHLMADAVRFITALGLAESTKADLLRELIMTGPPAVQKPALETLIRGGYDEARRVVRAVAGWQDPVLSPIAKRAAQNQCEYVLPGSLSVDMLPSAYTRAARAPASFEAYWEDFNRLGAAQRSKAGRVLSDRGEDFRESLKGKCRSDKPEDRLRAVHIVRSVRLQPHMPADIMRLARDEDPIVRSSAMSALVEVRSPIKRRILIEALQDRDVRVQANGVETLDRLGYDRELLGQSGRLCDPDNRIRANLVRAFLRLRPDDGTDALLDMLASPDRAHRISALWVIHDRALAFAGAGAGRVVQRLEEVARQDRDAQIRRRAQGVLAGAGSSVAKSGGFFLGEWP